MLDFVISKTSNIIYPDGVLIRTMHRTGLSLSAKTANLGSNEIENSG